MSHLLEKQYKRGERARKKNKQEERKMVHEISGKNGLKALHEYRVEMVTREQRKVAEELERIREGLRLHKGQRWNAGARHKEAKRGLQIAAIVTPRREQPIFNSAKPVGQHQRGKLVASSSGIPTAVSGLPRAVKSGPFLTSRRPDPKTKGQDAKTGSVTNPVPGGHEKNVPRLQLHSRMNNDRDDAMTSSRSLGYMAVGAGRGDDNSDDSDSDHFDDSDGGSYDGNERPPHPDILKAILQGVVQCWEETVATVADPTNSAGAGTDKLLNGDIPSTATSIGDFLSPRGLGEKSDRHMDGNHTEKRKKHDNALSLALLKNMKANNVDNKNLVLENRVSVSYKGIDEKAPLQKGTLFTKVPSEESSARLPVGRRRRYSAKVQHIQSLSRLSASSRHSDVAETVEEYVAEITKDLPQIQEHLSNTASECGEHFPSARNAHSSASSTNHRGRLLHSAQSSKSSKVSETARSIERGSQRSYSRHVRTTNNKDSKNQYNQSRPGSEASGKNDNYATETAEMKSLKKNATTVMEQGSGKITDEEDSIPRVSFRLPPLKKESKTGNSSKSARSSLSSIHDVRDSTSDIRNNDDGVIKHSNSNSCSTNVAVLPLLQSGAGPKYHSNNRNRREKQTTTLPRLPLSVSVSSTPRPESQRSTVQDGETGFQTNSLADTSAHESKENMMSIDLKSTRVNPGQGIRYKKKLHVYQKSPRSNK